MPLTNEHEPFKTLVLGRTKAPCSRVSLGGGFGVIVGLVPACIKVSELVHSGAPPGNRSKMYGTLVLGWAKTLRPGVLLTNRFRVFVGLVLA